MDDTYYRYPVGSPEHYAAYERYFISNDGIDAAVPGNPQASYEVDNAYELAYERENEYLAQKDWEEQIGWWRSRGIQMAHGLLDDPQCWLGENWWLSSRAEHDAERDIDLEPF